MFRTLPLFIGLVVVLATGFVHGLWTDRWESPRELEAAVARLDRVPERLGPWRGRSDKLDPEAIARAGAAGYRTLHFTHQRSGEQITVILLCGKPGPMSVHRPEHCYRGAGFEMTAPAMTYRQPGGTGAAPAEFWTARFRKQEETQTLQLRIFWSWYAGGLWQAPGSPRLTFAGKPVLYKLYVIRETAPGQRGLEDDPAIDFLSRLVPELNRALSAP